jgi:hypothetical protein
VPDVMNMGTDGNMYANFIIIGSRIKYLRNNGGLNSITFVDH